MISLIYFITIDTKDIAVKVNLYIIYKYFQDNIFTLHIYKKAISLRWTFSIMNQYLLTICYSFVSRVLPLKQVYISN